MKAIHAKYLVDENDKKKAVLIPFREWKQILEDMEELEDIRAYDKAKSKKSDPIPFDQAVREIRKGRKR